MNRRWLFGFFATSAALAPLAAKAAGEAKSHKLALHVDKNDPEVMKLALNNARNTHDLFTERGETVTIEIVAYSQGLHMLRDDTSPVKEEIQSLRKKIPQLALAACGNTKAGMEKKEGKPVPLMSGAAVTPAGVVRLVELQEQGYAYVKP